MILEDAVHNSLIVFWYATHARSRRRLTGSGGPDFVLASCHIQILQTVIIRNLEYY